MKTKTNKKCDAKIHNVFYSFLTIIILIITWVSTFSNNKTVPQSYFISLRAVVVNQFFNTHTHTNETF